MMSLPQVILSLVLKSVNKVKRYILFVIVYCYVFENIFDKNFAIVIVIWILFTYNDEIFTVSFHLQRRLLHRVHSILDKLLFLRSTTKAIIFARSKIILTDPGGPGCPGSPGSPGGPTGPGGPGGPGGPD